MTPSRPVPSVGAWTIVAPELRRIVGDQWVLTDAGELRTYASDGLLQYEVTPRGRGPAGLRPTRCGRWSPLCAAAGVPWVARGAGSGLSGGALPIADGVLIVLSRLTRVLEVDLDNGRVLVEPGVTNAAVSAAVGPHLFYPPDPSSQIVCTIGGNVAENSGGAHCFKYGFTTNYVVGLEVVLADGTVVHARRRRAGRARATTWSGRSSARRARWASPPRIWLRVVPRPEAVRTLVAFFDSTREAGRGGVARSSRAGIVPGAIEMMDSGHHRRGRGDGPRRLPGRARRGPAGRAGRAGDRVRRAASTRWSRSAPSAGSDDVRVARRRGAASLFWKTRKSAFPAMGRLSPNYFVQDGVIPRTRLPEVLARIEELSDRVRAARGQRVPRRRRQPAPAGLLRRPGRRARRRGPRSSPGASSTSAWTRAAPSPASTASAWTSASTCRRCSPRPTWTRSSACAARSTRPGWPTRAR